MSKVSVLLPVRNWDLTRVKACVKSLNRATDADVEVVVLDYGSEDPAPIRALAEELDCVFDRVEVDGWSRSRAMNMAAQRASGDIFLFADADMVFTPLLPARLVDMLQRDPDQVVILQSRDLPSSLAPSDLVDEVDFDFLDRLATWRPRWGMGVQAQTRATFERLRGFDERILVYGGEDNDISKRARANGLRLQWLSTPEAAMYHVWHPPTRAEVSRTEEGMKALELNRQIAYDDHSQLRNLRTVVNDSDPLVSVVISTKDRAALLAESLRSVLAQTVQDFEVIVMDDGSKDNTRHVVEGFSDPRIRYIPSTGTGLASARNQALDHSRGRYTAIHDDDDIMLPWSLESRLSALTGGHVGSYGGYVDFNDESAELIIHPGREATLANVLYGGKVFAHATLLIETSALRSIRYDPVFRSGSDYNLALRFLHSGYKLKHCGDVVLLRRIHDSQITATDPIVQKGASYATSFALKAHTSAHTRNDGRRASQESREITLAEHLVDHRRLLPFLPDHLVNRQVLALKNSVPVGWFESVHVEGRHWADPDSPPTAVVYLPQPSSAQCAEALAMGDEATVSALLRGPGQFIQPTGLVGAVESRFPGSRLMSVNQTQSPGSFDIYEPGAIEVAVHAISGGSATDAMVLIPEGISFEALAKRLLGEKNEI